MSAHPPSTARRAARLLRWYPTAWRERYGEEFTELLLCDLVDRPRSWRRHLDVARTGLVARLAAVGLGGRVLAPSDQVRASLVSLGFAVGAFAVFAVATWSQLAIGWQWAAPDTTSTTVAVVVMSGTLAMLASLALVAAVPVVWAAITGLARRAERRALVVPSSLFLLGVLVLILGSRHFGNGWPGTGGHPWAHRGLVPGGAAAFAWASTLSISSYWAHPGALSTFPSGEIVWMALSPLAVAAVVVGAVMTMRRLKLTPRTLRFEARLSMAAAGVTVAFLGACAIWMIDGGAGPHHLFQAGAIDAGALGVMVTTSFVACRAAQRARWGRRPPGDTLTPSGGTRHRTTSTERGGGGTRATHGVSPLAGGGVSIRLTLRRVAVRARRGRATT